MKRLLALFSVLVLFMLTSCQLFKRSTTENTTTQTTTTAQTTTTEQVVNKPVINGVQDITIVRGQQFKPLEGITAYDVEDGDLTSQIQYSGNVNPNVVGEYWDEFTVTDSDGNTTTARRKVTVIFVDTEAPILSGVGDIEVIVGQEFDPMDGVAANDTVDGNLTDSIVVEGSVNVWVPDEYFVKYSVSDNSNNKIERTRKVTVTLGDFDFAEENLVLNGTFDENYDNWASNGTLEVVNGELVINLANETTTLSQTGITGGELDEEQEYSLVRLTFQARSANNIIISTSLTNAVTGEHSFKLSEEMKTYTVYYKTTEALDNAEIKFYLGSNATVIIDNIKLNFGRIIDKIAPEIKGGDTPIHVPVGRQDIISYLALQGVTATDNFDGNVTSRLQVDFSDLDINTVGERTIKITVTDNAGNTVVKERTAYFYMMFDSGIIKDPGYDGDWDTTQWTLSGGGGEVTAYTQDGVLVVDVVTPGGWDSATSPTLVNVTTDSFNVPGWYLFTFKVKADKDRSMKVRGGLDLGRDPWIEDFEGASNVSFRITTEWVTHYVVFYIHAAESQNGLNRVAWELKVGSITWGDDEKNNKIYFDDTQFYYLSMQDEAPEITPKTGIKTTYAVGDQLPDFTQLVRVIDKEDGEITVTNDMVDASQVNMNQPGEYDVIYTVTDSYGNEVSYTLKIKVLAEADTTPPTITINDDLPTEFDQFEEVEVDLKDYITVVDDIDGEIEVQEYMIDEGTFDLNVAGEHVVTYSVKDSSGNETTITITFIVRDKEGPKITGAINKKIFVGDSFDPLEGVTVTDNVDGPITLTLDHIEGSVDTSKTGVYTIIYRVSDQAGNETVIERIIEVVSSKDIVYDDENALELIELEKQVEDNGGEATSEYVNGELIVTIGNAGQWASYVKMKYYQSDLQLEYGKNYKIVIIAKAEKPRKIGIKLGKALAADPWFEIYEGLEPDGNYFMLSTEYQTFEFEFTVDKEGDAALEVLLGVIDWSDNEHNNVVTFQSIAIVPEKIIHYDEDNAIDLLTLEKSAENAESSYVDGELVVEVGDPGGWASYVKMKYSGDELPFEIGKRYKLVIEVKASKTRRLGIKIGEALNADPWILPYEGIEESGNLFDVTTDFKTIEYSFVVTSGNPVFEFWFGSIDWTDNERDITITLKTLKILPALN